ncbi:hypothetical protein PQX77_000154 [Marasmius sp. AFHP31]|nr:hypothetical protein PQX77_000154 [Marasmius sp. AFHP31]
MSRREPDVFALTKLDSLILAQAVFELGTDSWPSVAKLLSKHPLLSHPKSFFTPQSCQAFYGHLRKEASLEITEADVATRAPSNLELAKIHYQARYLELRELIGEKEEEFKKTLNEIERIRNETQNDKKVEETTITTASPKAPSEVLGSPPMVDEHTAAEEIPVDPEATESENKIEMQDVGNREAANDEALALPPREGDHQNPSAANSPQAIEIEDLLEPDPEDEQEVPPEETKGIRPADEQPPPVDLATDNITIEDPTTSDVGHEEVHPSVPSPKIPERPTPPSLMEVDEERSGPTETPADIAHPETSHTQEEHTEDKKIAEATPDPEDVVEDEGASSGDEPLNAPRNRRGSRRGRSTTTRSAKARRRRRSSAATEVSPREQDTQVLEGVAETDTDSPVPEAASSKRGKRRASVLDDSEGLRDKKRARDGSEPVEEEESGPISASAARARRRADAQTPAKKFQNVIGMLHSQISQHRNGTIFHNPIRDSEAPDYHDIVKRPMDLKTIKAKIRDGIITNSLEFQRDIYLMFANAMMYNRPGSDVYVMAEDMMLDCEDYIQTFRQTEGFLRGSQR